MLRWATARTSAQINSGYSRIKEDGHETHEKSRPEKHAQAAATRVPRRPQIVAAASPIAEGVDQGRGRRDGPLQRAQGRGHEGHQSALERARCLADLRWHPAP